MCIWLFAGEKKIIFDNITAFFDLDNFEVSLQHRVASWCNQLLPEISSNQFETLLRCYKHIAQCACDFLQAKKKLWQKYGIFDLDNFQIRLQYGVASLCNQLLSGFSNNQFETLHRCYTRIEYVYVTFFAGENIIFDKIRHFDLVNFEVRFHIWGNRVCVINSSQSFQTSNLKLCTNVTSILKMCMWLCADAKNLFEKNYSIFDFLRLDLSMG